MFTPSILTVAAANCGFGDKDGKTLYITASTGLYRIHLREAGTVPGKR